MALSRQVRRMLNKWDSNSGWPKRLEWVEIEGIRGWHGQRVDFPAPIVAVVGENGSGKSTLLQAAASAYSQPEGRKRPTHLSISRTRRLRESPALRCDTLFEKAITRSCVHSPRELIVGGATSPDRHGQWNTLICAEFSQLAHALVTENS